MTRPRCQKVSGNSKCDSCPAWKTSLFSGLSSAELEALSAAKVSRDYPKGAPLFEQGAQVTGIFCIGSGAAKITEKMKSGKETIVRIAPPGDTIGHRSIFLKNTFRGNARGIGSVNACFIPKEKILHLLSTHPDFALGLITRMAKDLDTAELDQKKMREKNTRERLAYLLLKIKEAYGLRQKSGEWTLGLELTKVELASILGAADETVIRLMSEFKQDGLILQNGKTILLTDIEKLAATAGETPSAAT